MRDLFAVVIIILLTPSVAIADEPDPIVDAIVGIRQPESTIEAMLARLMPKATPEERQNAMDSGRATLHGRGLQIQGGA